MAKGGGSCSTEVILSRLYQCQLMKHTKDKHLHRVVEPSNTSADPEMETGVSKPGPLAPCPHNYTQRLFPTVESYWFN